MNCLSRDNSHMLRTDKPNNITKKYPLPPPKHEDDDLDDDDDDDRDEDDDVPQITTPASTSTYSPTTRTDAVTRIVSTTVKRSVPVSVIMKAVTEHFMELSESPEKVVVTEGEKNSITETPVSDQLVTEFVDEEMNLIQTESQLDVFPTLSVDLISHGNISHSSGGGNLSSGSGFHE